MTSLKKQQSNLVDGDPLRRVIQAGIDKLDEYLELAFHNPVYVISIGEWLSHKAI